MSDPILYRDPREEDYEAGKAKRGRPGKWPFMEMVVGQTVAIDQVEYHKLAKAAASRTARVMGRKFVTTKMLNGVLLIERIE